MPELLLELLSEEIPARMQTRAAEDLKRLVCDHLKEAGLTFTRAESFATPRRLALFVADLPERQPDTQEERRGPRIDAPAKAIDGFLRSTGLTIDQCDKRETEKGTFLFAVIQKKGRPLADVFHEIIYRAVWNFPWPKSMRWIPQGLQWVRPLHGILLIFNGKPLGIDIPLLHPRMEKEGSGVVRSLRSSDRTFGHRFLASEPVAVRDFADYKEKLRAAKVMLDAAERRRVIGAEAHRLATAEGFALKPDEALLDEVAGLVEWPVVLIGSIDQAYMDLPPEVLTTAMRHHQKYFSLTDDRGQLAPRFIVVAGTEAIDGGKAIIAGNERVLRARLADARYFWDRDRTRTLASRVPELDDLVFHDRLGSVGAKVKRLQALVKELAAFIPGIDVVEAEHATRLCKADLVTEMVGEFPELQGIMGSYYAIGEGAGADVASAIASHYAPQGPNDVCPKAPISVAVALADKIDTLAGFWGIREKPTGSKDPYALRRAALGVIRLIVENDLRVPLTRIITAAHDAYPWSHGEERFVIGAENLGRELLEFFADRLKVHLRERGVRHDLIAAVFAAKRPDGGREDDLVRLLARVRVLQGFLADDDGGHLLIAYRRAANIVRIEEKKDRRAYNEGASASLLTQDEEIILYNGLEKAGPQIVSALAAERFADAMTALAALRGPVDAFFDRVTVNCDQPQLRENRLRLLAQIRSALEGVADFSRIEG